MKKLIIIVLLPMLALMLSCHDDGGARRYDSRLVRADSLLRCNEPDSALGLLTAIDGAKLSSAGDRAYHALLLTQAQYRCYADITSDSTINVALDYYKHHDGEREKLTRAYIYKGAVMEVLGDAEQAMSSYKQAQATVQADDLFNQGYIRLRMGNIYRDNLVVDSSDIRLFKEALTCFRQIPDTIFMIMCLGEIGSCNIKINKDSAVAYLNRAIDLAVKSKTVDGEYKYKTKLAEILIFTEDSRDTEVAKLLALSMNRLSSNDELLMIASYALAKQEKPDSAAYCLDKVAHNQLNEGLQVFYEKCLAEIARCRGDIVQYQNHSERSHNLADSLVNSGVQRQLRDAEAKYDNEALKYEALRYKTNWQLSLMGALLTISALAIALLWLSRKSAQRKRQVAASEDIIEQLQSDAARLSLQLAENQTMNEGLKTTIHHQIDTFTQLVEMHYTQFTYSPKKFGELFRKTYSVNQPDVSFWSGIRAYADSTCSGIITHTLESNPPLTEADVNFLGLCCCDLPTTVIMACMGYNDVHSVYNKKRRVAETLGLERKLDDYIMDFKKPKQL